MGEPDLFISTNMTRSGSPNINHNYLISLRALCIKQAKAHGVICIRVDGSIDPPTAPIFTVDNITYTLSGNITADSTDGIVIQRNNAVLDGAGFAITGKMLANSNGIVLDRAKRVTVENIFVGSFRNGIYGNMSNGGHITETSLMYNDYGIYLISSQFNTIERARFMSKE